MYEPGWTNIARMRTDLAELLAEVGKKTGILGHELDEFDDPWLLYAFEEWWDLEKEIYAKIVSSMERSNERGETDYDLSTPGLRYLVKPFMERNGFQDGAGWWIKSDEKIDGTIIIMTE